MAELALKDAAGEKARQRKAAARARHNLHLSVSRGGSGLEDEFDEGEDDESDSGDDDSRTLGGSASTWLERNSSSISDVNSAAAISLSTPAAGASTSACITSVPDLPYPSHLHAAFEVITLLGKGGFGAVFDPLDGVEFFVGLVAHLELPSSKKRCKATMQEARLLSKLYHSNVVRYHSTWIEGPEPPAQDKTSGATAMAAAAKAKTKRESVSLKAASHMQVGDEDDEDWLSPSQPSTMAPRSDESEDDDSEDDDDSDDSSAVARPALADRQYLYIQGVLPWYDPP